MQSLGHWISVSRLVPQQTAQICWRAPGSRGVRSECRREGKAQRALLYNPRENSPNSSERALQSAQQWLSSRDESMSEEVFDRESALEYFKELVDGALARQGLAASELTAFYVVQLLASFLQRPSPDRTTRTRRWRFVSRRRSKAAAPAAGQPETDRRRVAVRLRILLRFAEPQTGRRRLLRQHRRLRLQRAEPLETDTFSPVFAELAEKFVAFVDVLSKSANARRARRTPICCACTKNG